MTYVTRQETESSSSTLSHPGEVLIRKLTQSQGARSEYYETTDATLKRAVAVGRRPAVPTPVAPRGAATEDLANIEHVDRLLRDCQNKVADLIESAGDPINSALVASALSSLLQELWAHRNAREDDWIDLLNILQIILSKEEFETLPLPKREALATVFRHGLTSRQVGPAEVRRCLEVLAAAGFDLWRGIEDFLPES